MATYSNAESVLYKTVNWTSPSVGSPLTIITCPPNRIITILEVRLTFDSGFDSNPDYQCVTSGISPTRWSVKRPAFLGFSANLQTKETFDMNKDKLFIMLPNDILRIVTSPFTDTNQYRLYYLEEGT